MSEVNEAVETIIRHKASRIINNKDHTQHIEDFLTECGIVARNASEKETEDVFKICAVDAMIFDVGAALDIAEFRSREKRKEMLRKIFLKK